jgi:hypothetical protein
MTVDISHRGNETIYRLLDEAGRRCELAFDATHDAQAVWKIMLPGPGGTDDLYGTHRFEPPDAAHLRAWLVPIVGPDGAAELVRAVEAQPPADSDWKGQPPPTEPDVQPPPAAGPDTEGRNS